VTVADLGFDSLVNRCAGGAYDGQYCSTNGQCPGTCVGGTKNGELCTGAGNCPGGACPDAGTCGTATLCPALLNDKLGATCVIPLTSPTDVGTCLTCTSARKIDAVIGTFYGSLLPASTNKGVLKCQKDIGKRTAKLFDAVEKALSKCQDAHIKDPDQDADLPGCERPATRSPRRRPSSTTPIGKTCVDAATISSGARPSQILGEAPRFGACPVANTRRRPASRTRWAASPRAPRPAMSVLSVADPACSTLLCGNGQIDGGETCDDSNTVADSGVGADDICPPDCSVAVCSPTGTQSVTGSVDDCRPGDQCPGAGHLRRRQGQHSWRR
jgi:hypothetical protein